MKYNNLLKQYEGYTNEEISDGIIDGLHKYNLIIKSEIIAEKLLEIYGIKFYYLHEDFKRDLKKLLICARIRGIKIPKETLYSDITEEDVIERIMENKAYQEKIFKNIDFIEIGALYDEVISTYERIINDTKMNK